MVGDRGVEPLKDQEAVRQSLLRIRRRIEAGQEGEVYGTKHRVLQDLNALLANPTLSEARFVFSPTGDLQSLFESNGWAADFMEVADKLERLLEDG